MVKKVSKKKKVVKKKDSFNYKNIKKLDCSDMTLIKFSSMAFILLIISIFPGLTNLFNRTHWSWFLLFFIIFSIKPFLKFYCNKK